MPWIANETPRDGLPFNVEPLEVDIVGEDGDFVIVRVQASAAESRVKREFVWNSELEARIGLRRCRYKYVRCRVARLLLDGERLPSDSMRPALNVRMTGNPLRLGEKNRIYGAQGNTFGSAVTVQKILQLLAVAREALLSLTGTLQIIEFSNDFTKKLLAKYAIIEANTIYKLFCELSRLDSSYAAAEHQELLKAVSELEKIHSFKAIRDKIGAHLDANLDLAEYVKMWSSVTSASLHAYLQVIEQHLISVMQSRYTWEYRMYILAPEKDISGAGGPPMQVAEQANREYVPFDGLDL